jgi:hypothetical protein
MSRLSWRIASASLAGSAVVSRYPSAPAKNAFSIMTWPTAVPYTRILKLGKY